LRGKARMEITEDFCLVKRNKKEERQWMWLS
jgi:hypothetical protein